MAYQTGNHAKAVAFIDKAIKILPTNAGFHSNRGLPLQALGKFDAALASYDKALALKPDYPEAHCNRANAYQEMHKFEAALAGYDRAIALRPNFADAYYSRGVTFQLLGRAEEALANYDRALGLRFEHGDLHYNRGRALRDLGRYHDAIASYDRALAFQPRNPEIHCNRGNVFSELGQHSTAIACYDRAIAIAPAATYFHNRGNAQQKARDLEGAVTSYDKAIALEDKDPETHFNRAIALQKLGKHAEALAGYEAAIALGATQADIHFNRAVVLKDLGRTDEALAAHERALEQRPDYPEARTSIFWIRFAELKDAALVERLAGEIMQTKAAREIETLEKLGSISDFRALHDLEQTGYLIAKGYDLDGLHAAHGRLQEINARHTPSADPSALIQHVPLGDAEIADLARWRRQLFRYQPQVPQACLNPDNDWAAIEDQYFASTPEIIHIDNLLAPDALKALREFCLASAVWRTEYKNQYLGAFAEEGFVSPLHFRIAEEFKAKMPRVFGPHRLEHLWGFKYSSRMDKGINVHADFARVNLNFWVTPDEANLDPESGGLVVYDVPAPLSWSFDDYNTNEEPIYAFLAQSKAGSRRVPYRCNRAVLFNSSLFHETDALHFKPGFENRRVNITYLFGKGLRTY